MRLKSLEIKGFKSFADKTFVNLDNQITGIVGPNGCGKSNIVDAIRWVIGEHKIRTLRSQSLEDLIFNGSKSRNGSGLAEVNLTFENTKNLLPTEYNTITIGRKFFKNGESEYRLNDVNCRLKDITNLFMDTGVSSDSYAIIELGMVDEIIKDKENSRRRMLEQAAGISVYKTRRKEAESKLKSTEQDLNRIEDLLFEISNNLRTLKSQAKKAEKYLEIKNEYKKASIEFVKASLEDFNSSYQTLNEQQKTEVDKMLELETSITKDDAQLEADKLALLEKEKELADLQRSFNQLTDSIRTHESQKNLSMQRIEHLKELNESIAKNIAEAEIQISSLTQANEEGTRNIEKHLEGLEEFKLKVDEVRMQLDEHRQVFDQKKTEVDHLQNRHQQKQIQGFETEKKMALADSEVNNFRRTIEQAQSDISGYFQRIDANSESLKNCRAGLEEEKGILQGLEEKQKKASGEILSSQEKLESVRLKWMEASRFLDARQNEYHWIENLIEQQEGYPESIKYLKKNEQWNSSAPLLSEVFEVPEEYTAALESYLDKYLNYYVVDTREEAIRAIQLLKNNEKGKVGFFILSEIGTGTDTKRDMENAEYLPSVIRTEEKYRKLFHWLLQNVYITDHIPEDMERGITLLNKEGSLFGTRQTLVGGFKGVLENHRIGRQQRLDKLKTEIGTMQEKVSSYKEEIGHIQEDILGFNADMNEDLIAKKRSVISEMEIRAAKLERELEHLESLKKESEDRVVVLQEKIETIQLENTRIKELFQNIQQEIEQAFNTYTEGRVQFEGVEKLYNEYQEKYNTQNIILTKQQSKINELKHENEIRSQRIEEAKGKVEEYTRRKEETGKYMEETETGLKDTEETLYGQLKRKEADEAVVNKKDQDFYNFRNRLNEFESSLNKRRREKEQIENILNTIKDKLNEMKLELTSMKERLHIEFKVDLDAVLDQPREDERPVGELNEEVEKLRGRIANLGDINPMAVEAFTEMKSRFDFIEEQKKDLTDAKENLLQTIQEVEETANQKFVETFERVRENFINVFKALFTEDDACDMKLTDPDNPAESGVEIYAQPKGKNPKTITQLSGGEKTLTSTAFLFAIYLIKPAPFCILDEVDAPLDDANVAKFMKMIRQFSDNSQFIIVTHNKQTMAEVDVIYGVTMQEAGVSKLVPVDFRSLDHQDFVNN